MSALNKRPLERLGYLRPDDIRSSEGDSIKVQEAQKAHHLTPFSEPDWQTQEKLQEKYEKNSKNKFFVGTFVYLDQHQNVFSKSFHTQVCIVLNKLGLKQSIVVVLLQTGFCSELLV